MIYTRRDSIKKKDLSIEDITAAKSSLVNTKKASSINRVRPRTTSLSIPKHVDDREEEEYSGFHDESPMGPLINFSELVVCSCTQIYCVIFTVRLHLSISPNCRTIHYFIRHD